MKVRKTRAQRRAPKAAGVTLALALALGAGGAARAQQPQPELPSVKLTAGVHLITAEVAATDPARTMGLMFRRKLAPNHGMLFVFDRSQMSGAPCMWMRNTLLPLSVAFIGDGGRIVNIEDMDPGSEQIHCAESVVPYALEMSRGWFRERGLRPGQTVIGGLPGPSKPGPPGQGGAR